MKFDESRKNVLMNLLQFFCCGTEFKRQEVDPSWVKQGRQLKRVHLRYIRFLLQASPLMRFLVKFVWKLQLVQGHTISNFPHY